MNTLCKFLLPTVLVCAVAGPPARGESVGCPPTGVEIVRARFASAVEEREPVAAPTPMAPGQDLYFFTEVSGAQDQRLLHRWLLDGRPLALVRLQVGGERWRTWSQVRAADLKPGALTVTVESPEGCQLATQEITVAAAVQPEATVAQAKPAQLPAEPVEFQAEPAAEPMDEQDRADELARRTEEALKLYEQAIQLREQERYTKALEHLERALELLPSVGAEAAKLRDERFYHTPLAKARYHLRRQEAAELRQTLAPIRGYLYNHPQRFEYTRILENYHKALYLLERRPVQHQR